MGRSLGRKTMTVLTGLALVVASGCASNAATSRSPYASPPPREASLDRAPGWLVRGCRAWFADPARDERVVCGIGSAPAYRDRVAARETAIARGRAEIARSLEVTIESLVRLTERGANDVDVEDGVEDGELESIVHQLSSTSMRGLQVTDVWRADTGETYALVALDVELIAQTVRDHPRLAANAPDDLAARAAAAFAAYDRQRAAAAKELAPRRGEAR